jgi:ABC-type phosphate/phosphonate transport system permease subunit
MPPINSFPISIFRAENILAKALPFSIHGLYEFGKDIPNRFLGMRVHKKSVVYIIISRLKKK